jgi:hypothetical protein
MRGRCISGVLIGATMTWEVNFSIVDEKGQTGHWSWYLDAGMPATDGSTVPLPDDQVELFVWTMALLVEPCISGAIRRITITKTLEIPAGFKLTAEPLSDVEEGLVAEFSTSGNFRTRWRIPTWREDLLDGQSADMTAEITAPGLPDNPYTVSDIFGMFTNPEDLEIGYDWQRGPTDSRNENIVALLNTRENFKAR